MDSEQWIRDNFILHYCLLFQADASERLRQAGISHMYPHPVRITQTRSCPLEPPPPPEVVPAWKLIRPKKKKTTPSDEPIGKSVWTHDLAHSSL